MKGRDGMAEERKTPAGAGEPTSSKDLAEQIKNRVLEQIADELRSQEHQGMMMMKGKYVKHDGDGYYTRYDK